MKNFAKFLTSLMLMLIMAASFASPIAEFTGNSPQAVFNIIIVTAVAVNVGVGVAMLLTKTFYNQPIAALGVTVEIWVNYIIENLFKNNEFMNYAFNDDQYIIGGKIVHIPVAGAKPNVVKNRTSLPAVIVQRTDNDILYAIDEFTSDPTHIPHADTVELSYDKIDSVLGEHVAALRERIADELLIKWVKSTGGTLPDYNATVIPTTGVNVAAHAPGATGNRKMFTKEDIKRARFLMNKNNISQENRFILLDSEFMDQLHNDADLKKRDVARELDMKAGVIERLYGFNIMERSSVNIYDNANAVKAFGAATATTDNAAAIAWQQNAVARAAGDVEFFEDLQNPTMYGDIYSALVRMGGRIRRQEGVFSIVQAPGV